MAQCPLPLPKYAPDCYYNKNLSVYVIDLLFMTYVEETYI